MCFRDSERKQEVEVAGGWQETLDDWIRIILSHQLIGFIDRSPSLLFNEEMHGMKCQGDKNNPQRVTIQQKGNAEKILEHGENCETQSSGWEQREISKHKNTCMCMERM